LGLELSRRIDLFRGNHIDSNLRRLRLQRQHLRCQLIHVATD
jgi:hypothetical protein